MTVAELMEKLAALDPKMEVMVGGYEYGVTVPSEARVVNINLNYHDSPVYGGPHEIAYRDDSLDNAKFDKQIVSLISR